MSARIAANGTPTRVAPSTTTVAARRVRQIISDGVDSGAFRPVHAAFVAEVLALVMTGIGQGNLAKATGLDDAQAYRQLVDLIFSGITA